MILLIRNLVIAQLGDSSAPGDVDWDQWVVGLLWELEIVFLHDQCLVRVRWKTGLQLNPFPFSLQPLHWSLQQGVKQLHRDLGFEKPETEVASSLKDWTWKRHTITLILLPWSKPSQAGQDSREGKIGPPLNERNMKKYEHL